MSRRGRRGLLGTVGAWAVGIVVILAVVARWTTVSQARQVDLAVYVAGGDAVVHGHGLYAVIVGNGHGGILRFTYPPFAALVFAPLAMGGQAAGWVFTSLSVASYITVVVLCARTLRTPWTRALLLAVLGLALEPVQRTLLFGQVNLVLLALVVVDVLAVKGRWRGVLVGVAAGIKLTPLAVVAWFLVKRDYRAAATTLLATAATVALGWLVLPEDSRRYWFSALGATGRFGPEARLWGNQSVTAVVDRATQLHGLAPVTVQAFTVVGSLVAVALALVAAVRLTRAGRDLAALSAISLGGLMAAPVAWTHHYVWVVPVLYVLVDQRAWVWVGSTAVVFFLPPMWALAGRGDLQLGYSPVEVALSAAWLVWSFSVLCLWALRPRSGGPEPGHESARTRPESEVRPVDRVGV